MMSQPRLRTIPLAAAGALCFLAAGLVRAECPQGGMPIYDPASETTFTAVVEQVQEHACNCCRRGGTGIHLQVKSEGEAVEALLGPAFYLREAGLALAAGDVVEITGSVLAGASARMVLVRSIHAGEDHLSLRDERGLPLWSPRGRN